MKFYPAEDLTTWLSPGRRVAEGATCPAWKWGPVYDERVVFSTSPDGTVLELTTTLFLQKMFNQNATFVRAGAAG